MCWVPRVAPKIQFSWIFGGAVRIFCSMCGRYTLHKKADDIAKRYNLAMAPKDVQENFNVAPGQIMPVVTDSGDGPSLQMMKWGLVPFWAKDPKIGYRLINARDDTIFDKPMWRKVILKKRCLIPADGFYEWKKLSEGSKERKQPFYIRPKQTDVFSFAGVWETWKDSNDQKLFTYSIITTEPNKEMAKVHNRMPVIVKPSDEAAWLEPSRETREEIEPFLHPYEDGGLEMYKVSEDVNSPRNNDKHLIYALDE